MWQTRSKLLSVSRDPTHRLLLLKGNVSHGLPAHVELALVLVRPLLVNMVRTMSTSWGKVDEERPIWRKCPVVANELDGLICLQDASRKHAVSRSLSGHHVFREVVALLRRSGRLNGVRVLIEPRKILARLPSQEASSELRALGTMMTLSHAQLGIKICFARDRRSS